MALPLLLLAAPPDLTAPPPRGTSTSRMPWATACNQQQQQQCRWRARDPHEQAARCAAGCQRRRRRAPHLSDEHIVHQHRHALPTARLHKRRHRAIAGPAESSSATAAHASEAGGMRACQPCCVTAAALPRCSPQQMADSRLEQHSEPLFWPKQGCVAAAVDEAARDGMQPWDHVVPATRSHGRPAMQWAVGCAVGAAACNGSAGAAPFTPGHACTHSACHACAPYHVVDACDVAGHQQARHIQPCLAKCAVARHKQCQRPRGGIAAKHARRTQRVARLRRLRPGLAE